MRNGFTHFYVHSLLFCFFSLQCIHGLIVLVPQMFFNYFELFVKSSGVRWKFMRYVVSGGIGTIITLLSIGIFNILLSNLWLANSISYMLGFVTSLFVHCFFTFQKKLSLNFVARYVCIFFLSYLLNLLIIHIIIHFWPNYQLFSQYVGWVSFVVIGLARFLWLNIFLGNCSTYKS